MLEITRIDHFSMAAPAIEPQVRLLESLFGFRREGEFDHPGAGFRGVTLTVPGRSGIRWEVLAPLGDGSHVQRFLDGPHGPGLHHLAFEVPDIEAATLELRALGIEPWEGRSAGEEGFRETYIHPRRGGNGLLFQLFEADERAPWRGVERQPAPPAPAVDGALGIKAINHLAHAHPNREWLSLWYEQVFGMRTFHRSAGGEHAGFSTQVLETRTAQTRWEVLQPEGERSFVQRFLDARGPAPHHVAFEVGHWDQALAACAQHGVPTFGEREGETDGARWQECFIHPRHTGGLLAQFFWQERPGIWI